MLICELLVSIALTRSEQKQKGGRLANPHTKATSTVPSVTKSFPAWGVPICAKLRRGGNKFIDGHQLAPPLSSCPCGTAEHACFRCAGGRSKARRSTQRPQISSHGSSFVPLKNISVLSSKLMSTRAPAHDPPRISLPGHDIPLSRHTRTRCGSTRTSA